MAQIGPNVGSCGTAAYLGRPVVTTSIATDPRWDDYRALQSTGACLLIQPHQNHQAGVGAYLRFIFMEPREPNALQQEPVQVCLHLCALVERDASAPAHPPSWRFDATLTGPPNRAMFRNSAERALSSMARDHCDRRPRFRGPTDSSRSTTQGHAAGDTCYGWWRNVWRMRAPRIALAACRATNSVLLLGPTAPRSKGQTAQRTGQHRHAGGRHPGQINRPAPASGYPFIPTTAPTSTPGAPC